MLNIIQSLILKSRLQLNALIEFRSIKSIHEGQIV